MSPFERLEITRDEHATRRCQLAAALQDAHLDLICVFGPVRVAYLTGFQKFSIASSMKRSCRAKTVRSLANC
nr:aminopeptidase P family N-terminal domain-containing protein [Deinococcus aestuarii]